MGLPALEPIRDEDLPAFCRFLTANLSAERTPEQWAEAFRQDWGVAKPNNGFLIRDQGRIVGGIGAIYAERRIRGRPERFCNITSWCVLEAFRAQSMRLAMAVVSQPGFHFTDLTPTEVVSKTLQFLKFKPMNERQVVWPNVPWPFAALGGVRVVTDPDAIEQALAPDDAKVFRDHRQLPWLATRRARPPGRVLPRRMEAEPVEGRPRGHGAGIQRSRSVPAPSPSVGGAPAAARQSVHSGRVAAAAPSAEALRRSCRAFATRCSAAIR